MNGEDKQLTIEPRVTLLDALREYLHLTGTKKGCDHGQWGACTPGQICSAVAMLDEAKAGFPSFVTADLSAGGPVQLTDDEIRECMSGNM